MPVGECLSSTTPCKHQRIASWQKRPVRLPHRPISLPACLQRKGIISCMSPERLFSAVSFALLLDSGPTLSSELAWMDGHTSPKQRELLHRLCAQLDGNASYLEVGVLYGATLLAASYDKPGEFIGIDNFAGNTREVAWRNLLGCKKSLANIIEADVLELDIAKLKPVNVFFHDANSDRTLFAKTLTKLAPVLEENFILIADNWSFLGTRLRVTEAIAELKLTIYSYIQLMSKDCDINEWWNGWCIMVIQKKPMLAEDLDQLVELKDGVPVGAAKAIPLHAIKDRAKAGLRTIKDYGV